MENYQPSPTSKNYYKISSFDSANLTPIQNDHNNSNKHSQTIYELDKILDENNSTNNNNNNNNNPKSKRNIEIKSYEEQRQALKNLDKNQFSKMENNKNRKQWRYESIGGGITNHIQTEESQQSSNTNNFLTFENIKIQNVNSLQSNPPLTKRYSPPQLSINSSLIPPVQQQQTPQNGQRQSMFTKKTSMGLSPQGNMNLRSSISSYPSSSLPVYQSCQQLPQQQQYSQQQQQMLQQQSQQASNYFQKVERNAIQQSDITSYSQLDDISVNQEIEQLEIKEEEIEESTEPLQYNDQNQQYNSTNNLYYATNQLQQQQQHQQQIQQPSEQISKCDSHPMKFVKYKLLRNNKEKFCSKCAIQYALKGEQIEELLSEQEKYRKQQTDIFLLQLQRTSCECKNRVGQLEESSSTTKQFFQKQVEKVCQIFVEVEKILHEQKTHLIQQINDHMWDCLNQISDMSNKSKAFSLEMQKFHFDIVKNYDNIIREMEMDPFSEIINQYNQKIQDISKFMLDIDNKIVDYWKVDDQQVSTIEQFLKQKLVTFDKQFQFIIKRDSDKPLQQIQQQQQQSENSNESQKSAQLLQEIQNSKINLLRSTDFGPSNFAKINLFTQTSSNEYYNNDNLGQVNFKTEPNFDEADDNEDFQDKLNMLQMLQQINSTSTANRQQINKLGKKKGIHYRGGSSDNAKQFLVGQLSKIKEEQQIQLQNEIKRQECILQKSQNTSVYEQNESKNNQQKQQQLQQQTQQQLQKEQYQNNQNSNNIQQQQSQQLQLNNIAANAQKNTQQNFTNKLNQQNQKRSILFLNGGQDNFEQKIKEQKKQKQKSASEMNQKKIVFHHQKQKSVQIPKTTSSASIITPGQSQTMSSSSQLLNGKKISYSNKASSSYSDSTQMPNSNGKQSLQSIKKSVSSCLNSKQFHSNHALQENSSLKANVINNNQGQQINYYNSQSGSNSNINTYANNQVQQQLKQKTIPQVNIDFRNSGGGFTFHKKA